MPELECPRRLTDELRGFWRAQVAALPADQRPAALRQFAQHYGEAEAAALTSPAGFSHMPDSPLSHMSENPQPH